MNVPIDNLYDWIYDQTNDDCIIYRFFPHGSKNIKNLTQLHDRELVFNDFANKIPLICHDQEPLHFDLYQNQHWPNVKSWYLDQARCVPTVDTEQKYWEFISNRNMFSLITPLTWDRFVLLHSEQRSPEVDRYQNLAVCAYWWSHGIIARDWFRYAEVDGRLTYTKPFRFDFNVYARDCSGSRSYRTMFLDHISANPGLHHATRITDPGSQIGSEASASYDPSHYQTCAIDLVLETLFDDPRLHLTEKILRPIACGKPFILAASHGSLEYLKRYGFKTFQGWINEDYDRISDSQQRCRAIITEMNRIQNLSAEAKRDFYGDLHRIAKDNQRYFFSDAFTSIIENELKINLRTAIDQVKLHHQTGALYLQERRFMSAAVKQSLKRSNTDYIKDRVDFLLRCRSRRRLRNDQ